MVFSEAIEKNPLFVTHVFDLKFEPLCQFPLLQQLSFRLLVCPAFVLEEVLEQSHLIIRFVEIVLQTRNLDILL